MVLVLLPLAFLWFTLIDHLRVEWTVNPQYTYGWAVPFLCLCLLWQRRGISDDRATAGARAERCSIRAYAVCAVLLILLYAPIRLVQEANPEWRLVSWGLAGVVVGVTLLLSRLAWGATGLRRVAFPTLFFLVAVPWPTKLEAPLIQGLTRLNAAGAVEILNLLGTPALRQGNVIEISTGLVGVEDACSGIRSIQACLMIGLFLGAYYRIRYLSRVWLVLAGLALAILFNLCRTVLLVTVASRQGMDAIGAWHDPAGISILVGCFLGVWWVAEAFKRAERRAGIRGSGLGTPNIQHSTFNVEHPASDGSRGGFSRPALVVSSGILAWLVCVEAGVESWYRRHESHFTQRATWTVQLPREAAEFRDLPFSERTVQFLRFDEGSNAAWRDRNGERCQAIFLRWDPGRIAVHLARSHTPEVCLTAAGRRLAGAPERRVVAMDGLSLPFDVYHVAGERLWVYYCLWEDRVPDEDSATEQLTYRNRLKPVLEGRRNLGQRSLEFALWTDAPAEEALAQAEKWIQSLIQAVPEQTPSM